MTRTPGTRYRREIRRLALVGTAVTLLLVGGLGGWSSLAEVSGAVIATGRIDVVSEVKRVQHPTGGVVGTILVREGSEVDKGQTLIRLDDTVTRAELGAISSSLDQLLARQARLECERDGKPALQFPSALLDRSSDPAIAQILASEEKLFLLRAREREGTKASLAVRAAQVREEAQGLEEQIASKGKEQGLITAELEVTRGLWEKQLVQRTRLLNIEREDVRITGLLSELTSRLAQTRAQMEEIELQIGQVDRQLASEGAQELRDVEAKISELTERRIAAQDQLNRIDIVAPAKGMVHQLAVHTVGGVIAPGETLMNIVPTNDELEINAAVQPADIDQLHLAAPARIRFSAFNQRTTPELEAHLTWISPDVSTNEKTGQSYYEIRVRIPKDQMARLGELQIIPGMPAEVFVKTSDRTVISLLLKPVTDQIHRSFRQD